MAYTTFAGIEEICDCFESMLHNIILNAEEGFESIPHNIILNAEEGFESMLLNISKIKNDIQIFYKLLWETSCRYRVPHLPP